MNLTLGRLETVPLRQVWALEARDFTPWLAEPDNLALLAETLSLGQLQSPRTEVRVGNFNLDILAQDIEGHVVVIENQFGPTDHIHLGQIMTYLAGQDGNATIIWIAESFREEHRAAIDWLNASTVDGFNFFAVEVEALKIGNSLPAPWFNVVAKPNSWSRGIGQASRSVVDGQLDDRAQAYINYWSGFGAYLLAQHAPYKVSTPPRDYWCNFGIGRSGFVLSVQAGFRDRRLGVELGINHRLAKRAFDLLYADQQAIEDEFGEPLVWRRLDDKKTSAINVYRTDLDPRDEAQRPSQYEWFLDHMRRFADTFSSRIRALPLSDTADNDQSMPDAAGN